MTGPAWDQISARFWRKVAVALPHECWLWPVSKKRYGAFHIGTEYSHNGSRVVSAHQAAYLIGKGPITSGLHVLHTCDNDRCVNPSHLYLGTHRDNMLDRKVRHRSWRGPGALNPSAKLDETKAGEIKGLLKRGQPVARLAEQFGVSPTTIYRIRHGRRWCGPPVLPPADPAERME